MKTLIIHPADPTTDFLKTIYMDLECTILNRPVSNSILKKHLKEHDRIMIMGHGAGYGLFGYGRLYIDSSHVQFLQNKPNNVYIWCHADKFVERYELSGFYSGMFISEPTEADHYQIKASPEEIKYSNELFAQSVREIINSTTPQLIRESVKIKYNSEHNQVIKYNNARLYYK